MMIGFVLSLIIEIPIALLLIGLSIAIIAGVLEFYKWAKSRKIYMVAAALILVFVTLLVHSKAQADLDRNQAEIKTQKE